MDTSYSVLMSVYRKEKPEWLRESIESILAQSILPTQVVIVKDGPLTDELEDVLKDYESREGHLFSMVSLEQNQGLGVSLQKGVEACECQYIMRMDTDDYAVPLRAEKQLRVMEQYHADIVSSHVGEFSDSIDNIKKYKELPECHEDIYQYAKGRNPFNHPAVFFRKDKVLAAGNYQPFLWIEDYDLWLRMLEMGCIGYNIQEALVLMRVDDKAYERRGGMAYLKSMLAFNKKWKKKGWFSLKQYIVRSSASIVVTLVPNKTRDFLYKKLLRKG